MMNCGPTLDLNPPIAAASQKTTHWTRSAGVAGTLGGLCLAFLLNVAPYWNVNPQYSYGWLVPALCALLFWRRWDTRPAPAPVAGSSAKWLLAAVGFVFLPTWLTVQPNPDWRLATWALAGEFLVACLLTIYLLGGTAWLKHFAFPVLFLLTAVPWPFGLEYFLVQNLMRIVAGATVEILPWFNIAAVQHGNLIEVRSGTLGVDEACSGIRSLQATIMAALFLGEFYWHSVGRRFLLVGVGMLLAFVCNIGRAFLISAVAAQNGQGAVSQWHDPAGYTILTLCLIGLSLVAGFVFTGGKRSETRGELPPVNALPPVIYWVTAGWLVFSLVATEMWYRIHEGREKIHWSVRWPATRADFTKFPIPERAHEILMFDDGQSATWRQPDGTAWSAFFLQWYPGTSRSRLGPRAHNPEVCMPGSGYTMEKDYGVTVLSAHGIPIPFHGYRFTKNGMHTDVFSCLWQDRAKADLSTDVAREWSRWVGLRFVLNGERNLSQQVLEYTMMGYPSEEAAQKALEPMLNEMIVPVPGIEATAPLSRR